MTEDLQHALATTIVSMQDSVAAAKDFTLEQAPLVVKEFLYWTIIKNAVLCFGAVVVLVGIFLALRWLYGCYKKKEYPVDEDTFAVLGIASTVVLLVVGFFVAVGLWASGLITLEALVAPKWFLLEQASKLLK